MTKKLAYTLGMAFLLFSCQSPKENNSNTKDAGNYFFEFDALTHYRIEIEENKLLRTEDHDSLTPQERLQAALIIGDKPGSINDTSFVAELENIGFNKSLIPEAELKKVNELFKEKVVEETIVNECIAVYRDILVFRKNNRIIGIAKICFSCDENRIYGTQANTRNFGQGGGYGKLKDLLKDLP